MSRRSRFVGDRYRCADRRLAGGEPPDTEPISTNPNSPTFPQLSRVLVSFREPCACGESPRTAAELCEALAEIRAALERLKRAIDAIDSLARKRLRRTSSNGREAAAARTNVWRRDTSTSRFLARCAGKSGRLSIR